MPAEVAEERLAALEESVTQGRLQKSALAADTARLEAEMAQLEKELQTTPPEGRIERGYAELKERLLLSRTELAGMKAQREALAGELDRLEPLAAELRTRTARDNRARTRHLIEADAQSNRIEELSLGLHAMELAAADAVPDDRERYAALAKAHITDLYLQIARDSVEAHGGIGFTWECDVQIWFKRAMFDRAFLGLPSLHRERNAKLSDW